MLNRRALRLFQHDPLTAPCPIGALTRNDKPAKVLEFGRWARIRLDTGRLRLYPGSE